MTRKVTMTSPVRRRSRRAGGFSILELLLVLVILSILAGIVGVKFAGQSADAKIKAAQAQLTEFGTALDTYEIKTGGYPTTQQGLDALVSQPAGVEDWPGRLLSKGVPKDQWGNDWQYSSPGSHNSDTYDLFSYGPDGQPGGGDDITNWTDEN